MDAGYAGVDEILCLLGGELDADFELPVGFVAGFFELANERCRELGTAQGRDAFDLREVCDG